MSDRIRIATRKGLFTATRRQGRWHLGKPAFLGDPVSAVLDDEGSGILYAALNLGHFGVKLRRSRDDGATWEELDVPMYPAAPDPADRADADSGASPAEGAKLALIWTLEAGGGPGELWAGTIPGGLFRSIDHGKTWTLNHALWNRAERKEWFGGGYDQPGIHSILVDPRDRRRLTLGISCGGVWATEDGGAAWVLRASGMRAAYMPPELADNPNTQDPHAIVRSAAEPDKLWAQHHNGIFRSTDNALSWAELADVPLSAFGFAVAVHPRLGDTAWFVPAVKDETRVPVDARLAVTRTRDGGRSFEVLREGLPVEPCYDLVYRHGMAIDQTGERLAIGSTTGGLWVSENQGDTWQNLGVRLPPIYAVRFAA